MLSRASVRLYKAFFSSLVFKVGGWGKIPQNQRQGHFWAFYFICALKWPRQVLFFVFAVVPLFSKSLIDRLLISCYSIFKVVMLWL